jgi:S1-C subfamily serine protease
LLVRTFALLVALLAAPANRKTPVVEAVQRVGPAVVSVFSEQRVERNPFSGADIPELEQLFGRRPRSGGVSLGSGVIIDGGHGVVLTNAHVVANAARIKVELADGRAFRARILGADRTFDLAVLRLAENSGGLPALPMGTSKDLMIGETVIAIGNPLGLSHTVTTGVVSALHRTVPIDEEHSYEDLIQTDALINPGNSGGPLCNINGELIGINSAIRVGQGASYAFAIPIDRARTIVEDLMRFGRVRLGWIGARCEDREGSRGAPREAGACVVTEVEAQSPAQSAGLHEGDVVLGVGGEHLGGAADFASRVEHLLDGEEIALRLSRGTVKVRATYLDAGKVSDRARRRLGLEVVDVRGGGAGVSRVVRGGVAAAIGVRARDIFLQVGPNEVGGAADFWKAVGQLRPGTDATFVIQRGYYQYVVQIPL